jgi:hypothetical protein
MVFSKCFEPFKDSSCRIKLQISVSDPQSTLHTLVFGPGETVVLPDIQCLVHYGRSTIYSFSSFSGSADNKNVVSSLKGHSRLTVQFNSIAFFTIWALGVYWHIPYFEVTWRLEPSDLGCAHKTVFRDSHKIFSVLFIVTLSAIHEDPLLFLPFVLGPQFSVKVDFVPGHTDCTGYTVAQLVEALRYNSEGRGFDSRWGPWIFHWLNPSGLAMALVSNQTLMEMSARDISWSERGKRGRCVGLITLPASCADWLAILGASTSRRPKGLSRPV